MDKIDCSICEKGSACCRMGAWVDLDEAKRIAALGLQGKFFHLEKDDEYPSGYKVGTSYEEDPCTFLTSDGLCSIHKIDYGLKPTYCKEFPYEDGKISEFVSVLCPAAKHKKLK